MRRSGPEEGRWYRTARRVCAREATCRTTAGCARRSYDPRTAQSAPDEVLSVRRARRRVPRTDRSETEPAGVSEAREPGCGGGNHATRSLR
jgi:hypothetical protein